MLEDFTVLVGAITGAITIVGAGWTVVRRVRARRIRMQFEMSVARMRRQERRLGGVILELDKRLVEGADWVGWSDWPQQLGGELTYARGLEDEAEREEAIVRSLEAEGADERLRQDIEEMHRLLYKMAGWCVSGSLAAYRRGEGMPVATPSSGEAVTPVFTGVAPAELLEARRRFTTLMRSSLHRLGGGDEWAARRAEAAGSPWCIYRWEISRVDPNEFWGPEVRPMRWD